VVLGSAKSADPFGCTTVSLRALCPWDLSIGDIPNEQVAEAVLNLTRDG
jgi:hypothetical protein